MLGGNGCYGTRFSPENVPRDEPHSAEAGAERRPEPSKGTRRVIFDSVPFPQKLLNENEEIVLDLRPHWFFMAEPTAALLGSIILGIVVLQNAGDEGVGKGIKIVVTLLVLFCLAWFGIRYMKWVSTNFVVTTDRVIHRVGVISKRGIEIPLERINTVFFRQSMFERMFGLGDLGIESAGERGAETFE